MNITPTDAAPADVIGTFVEFGATRATFGQGRLQHVTRTGPGGLDAGLYEDVPLSADAIEFDVDPVTGRVTNITQPAPATPTTEDQQ